MAYSIYKYQRRRYWLNFYKQRVGCKQCGYNKNSYALHFDHVIFPKNMTISKMVKKFKLSKLFDEIRKCEVLCANCHAVKSCTHQRRVHNYEE